MFENKSFEEIFVAKFKHALLHKGSKVSKDFTDYLVGGVG